MEGGKDFLLWLVPAGTPQATHGTSIGAIPSWASAAAARLTSPSPSLEPDSWDRRLRSHRERLGRAGGPLAVRVPCTLRRMSLSARPGGPGASLGSPSCRRQAARRWARGPLGGSGDTGATGQRWTTRCGLRAGNRSPEAGTLSKGPVVGAGGRGQEAAYSVRNSRLNASAISPVSRVSRPRCRRASLHVKLGDTGGGQMYSLAYACLPDLGQVDLLGLGFCPCRTGVVRISALGWGSSQAQMFPITIRARWRGFGDFFLRQGLI